MNLKRIKERTYARKLLSFIVGLIIGWVFYLFIFAVFTEGDQEIPDKFVYLSMILSFFTMVIYSIFSDFNYLKRLQLTTSALYNNMSFYKKREKELLTKSEGIISKFLNHESDIQKTVAMSRAGNPEFNYNTELGSLSDLKVTIEKYPDLKADKHITNALAQIEESQNIILNSKLMYNDYVTYYNSAIISFPAVLFSGFWDLTPMEFYADLDD
ncbi:LemA family protein [Sinanaerobacter chloroacetimidivorans]|jgi:LemA protein|uniref:LemA family protein n=1 Tax=Sinanaerobacter chloroacetimidivorans TaxID=2818044 RepID=A0A8J7VYB0_9FIRM|nr:LemA family protein [Sinanaerobacter chloroacetimidivorans]MBR0596916.1 LemA family protein [Sinanaerobacter chloroacetimidivorans]